MGLKSWREYPKNKPTKSDWYMCSIYIDDGYGNHQQSYVMDLWWDSKTKSWRDNRRQNVFDTYEVYGHGKGPDGELTLIRKYDERLCIRKDVIAFKNLPKPYGIGMHVSKYQMTNKEVSNIGVQNTMCIKKVIFSDPATIVFWKDGTKTVVKCQYGDIFDEEKGLAMAISKKALGNNRDYYKVFKKNCKYVPYTVSYYADNELYNVAKVMNKANKNISIKLDD